LEDLLALQGFGLAAIFFKLFDFFSLDFSFV